MSLIITLIIAVSFALAVSIGSNDGTFAAVIGSKRLSMRQAVALGAVIIVVGAMSLGRNVSITIGKGLTAIDLGLMPHMILAILMAVSLTMIVASLYGLPLSSTHAMVGAVTFLTLFVGGVQSINFVVLWMVIFGWVLSPVFGFLGAFSVAKMVRYIVRKKIKGFDLVRKKEYFFANLLLVFVCVTAFSRAANDVSNAIAPIIGLYQYGPFPDLPLLIGGVGMAIGLVSLAPRVLKTMSQDIVELNSELAFSIQFSVAIVALTAATLGVPISGSHVQVSSFVGVSTATNTPTKTKTLIKILISALITPFIAAIIAIGCYIVLVSLI
ncbi:MAG: inorganic phosphate transporter [Candidatus Ranarchaeia archaeon]